MKQKMKYQTEEQKEIIKFLIVLVVIIVLIIGVYGISKIFVKPEIKDYAYQTGSINNTAMIVGTLFHAKESEYYVLAYDTTSDQANAYLTYTGYYTSEMEEPLKIYNIKLDNPMNALYYVKENSNPKATKIKDLKILDGTLLKIKNGKIVKYLEGIEAIKNELKVPEN